MFYPLLAVTLALIVQNPDSTPATPPAETASAALFSTDARLTQKITFATPAITLNDALKQFTTKTGIPVKMRDSKIVGVQKIAVFAEDVEARQVLESIAALLRYKNISSEWQKDATSDGYALSIGGQYYAAAARKANEPAASNAAITRTVIVDGHPVVTRSVNPGDVVVTPSEDGSKLTVTVTGSSGSPAQTVQATVLPASPLAPGIPSGSLAGTTTKPGTTAPATNTIKAKKPVTDDWFTRYDLRTTAQEETILSSDGTGTLTINGVAGLLSTVARQQKIPVIALLPDAAQTVDGSSGVSNTNGKTLFVLLDGLINSSYNFSHKWHKGALLLRDPLAPFR